MPTVRGRLTIRLAAGENLVDCATAARLLGKIKNAQGVLVLP